MRAQLLHDVEGISDEGLVQIAGLVELQKLYLGHTKITDAGLEHLARLTNLRSLDVRHTAVTNSGLALVDQALPNVKIKR